MPAYIVTVLGQLQTTFVWDASLSAASAQAERLVLAPIISVQLAGFRELDPFNEEHTGHAQHTSHAAS